MGININCKDNNSGAWCKNKNIKRSLWGHGSRCCVLYPGLNGKKCEYQVKYPRPTGPFPPPSQKKQNRICERVKIITGIFLMAYVLLTVLLIFQIIDVCTTYYLINLGAEESNIIILFLMKHFGDIVGLIFLKLFAMILLFLYIPLGWHKQWVKISLYTLNLVYFIVCLINVYLIFI